MVRAAQAERSDTHHNDLDKTRIPQRLRNRAPDCARAGYATDRSAMFSCRALSA
jgi:hypothetical protein